MKKFLFSLAILCATAGLSFGQTTVFSDSWADGGLDNGADASDIPWYTSTASNAIEVTTGSMGLVTGTSGRGIHGLFDIQDLNAGDSLTLTFTFSSPATLGDNRSNALRVGIFNSLGRTDLGSNQSLSSSNPNPLFDGLPGYMAVYDIATGEENISIYEHDVTATLGRFMSTTSEFTSLESGGDAYVFTSDTEFVVELTVTRSADQEVNVSSTLSSGGNVLSTFSTSDSVDAQTSFDMLGIQVGSNTFGSSNAADTEDNGLTFSNIMLVSSGGSSDSWAGYPIVNEVGDVDTDTWLGWINVIEDPWIYIYALSGWIYCPEENVGESGGWGYLPK